MTKIKLSSGKDTSVTLVPNAFIDKYMSSANGAYIKVYLFLLRCLNGSDADISIASIADKLDETESDVLRALKYWEKSEVILLTRTEDGQICDITLLDLTSSTIKKAAPSMPSVQIQPQPVPKAAIITQVNFLKPGYSPRQLEELRVFEEFNDVVDYIEKLCARTLTTKDLQTPAFLYEGVGLPPELIKYAFEYCIGKGKKSFPYIEKVAREWYEKGIRTVEDARFESLSHSKEYAAVCSAFGISRALGDTELQYLSKWHNDLDMSDTLIKEACNRTILKIGKADFKYANKILESWSKENIHSLGDIEASDKKFASKQRSAAPIIPSKFNNYVQRQYSAEDYSSIESKWIKKSGGLDGAEKLSVQ